MSNLSIGIDDAPSILTWHLLPSDTLPQLNFMLLPGSKNIYVVRSAIFNTRLKFWLCFKSLYSIWHTGGD